MSRPTMHDLNDDAHKLLCVVATHPSDRSAGQSLAWFRAQAGFDELVKLELVEIDEAEATLRLGKEARRQLEDWFASTARADRA
jgi:hypothetical protein